MNQIKQQVAVWGFPDEALQNWPSDLEPIPIQSLPVKRLLLVHSAKQQAFQQEVDKIADDDIQEAILYQANASELPDAWMYFDATVKASDWDTLRKLLTFPLQTKMIEWADEIPFAQADAFLTALDSQNALRSLPADAQQQLATEQSRQAFAQVLRGRLQSDYELFCPPMEKLAAYSWGQSKDDPWLHAHLSKCSACRAELSVMREYLPQPETATSVLKGILQQLASTVTKQIKTRLDNIEEGLSTEQARLKESLQVLLLRLSPQVRLHLVGSRARRGSRNKSVSRTERGALQKIKLTLSRTSRHVLFISWPKNGDRLQIERVEDHRGTRIGKFRLEIQKGPQVMWDASSEDGQVEIPLVELEKILQHDNLTLVIQAEA